MNQTDREEVEMYRRQMEEDALRGVYISPTETRYSFGKILNPPAKFDKEMKNYLKRKKD